jgi:hypothetical protein
MAVKKFIIWYAIWIDDEKTIIFIRKTKAGAKSLVRVLRQDFIDHTFGWKRLIEQKSRARRKRQKKAVQKPGQIIYPYGASEEGEGFRAGEAI